MPWRRVALEPDALWVVTVVLEVCEGINVPTPSDDKSKETSAQKEEPKQEKPAPADKPDASDMAKYAAGSSPDLRGMFD